MRPILLLIVAILVQPNLFARQNLKSTYVIVRMDAQVNRSTNTTFYRIIAEGGNPYAQAVYNLMQYNPERNAINESAALFHKRADTTTFYYNYFRNPTEALFFLSQLGWELITVNSEIRSGSQTVRAIDQYYPVTTVSSHTVYYLKKEIK